MITPEFLSTIAQIYLESCEKVCGIQKTAIVRKLPNGKYRIFSEKGKNLGTFTSKEKADKHLQEIEYFKHKKADFRDDLDEETIDFTDLKDVSYSAIMRELRKNYDYDIVVEFMAIYKGIFDILIYQDVDSAAELALKLTLQQFSTLHHVELPLKKEAQLAQLGNAQQVGQYLANIIKFTLSRISPEHRQNSINTVAKKLYLFNENELAGKHMPASSSIGQSITFVKNVLFTQDPRYIREVINNIIKFLG